MRQLTHRIRCRRIQSGVCWRHRHTWSWCIPRYRHSHWPTCRCHQFPHLHTHTHTHIDFQIPTSPKKKVKYFILFLSLYFFLFIFFAIYIKIKKISLLFYAICVDLFGKCSNLYLFTYLFLQIPRSVPEESQTGTKIRTLPHTIPSFSFHRHRHIARFYHHCFYFERALEETVFVYLKCIIRQIDRLLCNTD